MGMGKDLMLVEGDIRFLGEEEGFEVFEGTQEGGTWEGSCLKRLTQFLDMSTEGLKMSS